jgi:hypothetical protein
VAALEAKLDAIDDMKAKALPILNREIRDQQASVEAMHSDALELEKLAEELTGNRPTIKPAPVSGAAGGNGTSHTDMQENSDGKADGPQA